MATVGHRWSFHLLKFGNDVGSLNRSLLPDSSRYISLFELPRLPTLSVSIRDALSMFFPWSPYPHGLRLCPGKDALSSQEMDFYTAMYTQGVQRTSLILCDLHACDHVISLYLRFAKGGPCSIPTWKVEQCFTTMLTCAGPNSNACCVPNGQLCHVTSIRLATWPEKVRPDHEIAASSTGPQRKSIG